LARRHVNDAVAVVVAKVLASDCSTTDALALLGSVGAAAHGGKHTTWQVSPQCYRSLLDVVEALAGDPDVDPEVAGAASRQLGSLMQRGSRVSWR